MQFYQSLSNRDKGLILIASGTVLILYALGIVRIGLNYAIITGAAYLIYLGIEKLGGLQAIMGIFKKN